ncbi:hypothetical protein, partial [Paenibacillus xylanexedens]|uniref:hypothetical protein n=1 Tax=Paenibacillus xylanexedens TaxID=528191 RepID=UPI001C9318B5
MEKEGTEVEFGRVGWEYYGDVDVFIGRDNEGVDVLYKRVNGCRLMDYGEKEKVDIYMCDDGGRGEVEEVVRQSGAGYVG